MRHRVSRKPERPLPDGTVTFLVTDIVDSTGMSLELRDQIEPIVERHDEIVRSKVEAHDGHVLPGHTGDGLRCVFKSATAAIAASAECQLALSVLSWPNGRKVFVRMGLFTGDAQAAIRVVNAEEQNPTACAIVSVAYVRGPQIGMARRGDSAFEIVRVLVIGVETEDGIRVVRPAAYFSLFGIKEYAV